MIIRSFTAKLDNNAQNMVIDLKKLNERTRIATYGVPDGIKCEDGCCTADWTIGENRCHIQGPYPCQTNGSTCSTLFPATCCSGSCTQTEQEDSPTCKPVQIPVGKITATDWDLDRCPIEVKLPCLGIPEDILNPIIDVIAGVLGRKK